MNLKELGQEIIADNIKFGDRVWIACYKNWSSWNSGLEHLRDIKPIEVILQSSREAKGYPRKWGFCYFSKIGKKGQPLKGFIQSDNGMGGGEVEVFLTQQGAEQYYYEAIKKLVPVYSTKTVVTYRKVD